MLDTLACPYLSVAARLLFFLLMLWALVNWTFIKTHNISRKTGSLCLASQPGSLAALLHRVKKLLSCMWYMTWAVQG